ncbi:hypothetical protein ACG59Z_05765, partial [Acinetobacter sp. ABJ_C1_1]|uniref:hypothetical protein n=1 Tax=Acinetobacter sp. ABJ_C1_1 TaxID=3378321 RepID=UPI0037DC72FE
SHKCIINPYQVNKKIYLLDVDNLATFLFDNRLEAYNSVTKNEYLESINELLKDLDLLIKKYKFTKYFRR